jgi:hypothetical protein
MKVIGKYKNSGAAFDAINKLADGGIYSSLSGSFARGYEVLVRDSTEDAAKQVLGTANGADPAHELTPEVTK